MQISRLLVLGCISLALVSCGASPRANFSDEMKIARATDRSDKDGAAFMERRGDHKDSPYFSHPDFYNLKSTDSLYILPHFKTIQQSSIYTCGPAAALMVMNYFGKAGDWNEFSLAALRPQGDVNSPTSLRDEIEIFKKVGGWNLTTTLDWSAEVEDKMTLAAIRDFIKNDTPVLILWNDWGGHWQVIIGYDTMGTDFDGDDVLIVADSYDTTDHNQDGYGVYPAKRFISNFTTGRLFGPNAKDNDFQFIAVRPAEK